MSGTGIQTCYPSGLGQFFRSLVRDPLGVGAVLPSGRTLAKLMVRDVGSQARVVELGAGTGTVTEAILAGGVEPRHLCLIEQDEQFVRILRQRFPGALAVNADAVHLLEHLKDWSGSVDYVISGLPLMLIPSSRKIDLLRQAFELLGPEGRFHQFTYGGRCPVSRRALRSLGLKASRIGAVALNVPPAFVFRFARA